MQLILFQKGNKFVLETWSRNVHLNFVVLVVFVQLGLNGINEVQNAINHGFFLCRQSSVHLVDLSASVSVNFLRNSFAWSNMLKNYVKISSWKVWRLERSFTLVSNSLNCFSRSERYFSISSVASSFACFNLLALPTRKSFYRRYR